MSFLRTFRSNLILSTAPPADTGKSGGTNGGGGGRKSSSQGRKSQVDSDDHRATSNTARRSSNGMTNRNGNGGGTTANRNSTNNDSRYGKENPAPIVVYLDKPGQEVKKPASILRTNTFTTKHNDHVPGAESESIRYGSTAISRSDTFTIDDPAPTTVYTNTFTRREPLDVFEPLYAKNIELGSNEKLPTVVDSRTYRKKSRNTVSASKPVQKVESFIKRFERTLFNKNGSNDRNRKHSTTARKNSSSAGSTTADSGPRFRDIGINCKLDEEERFRAKVEAMRRSRQGSRDSIISGHSTTSGMVQQRRSTGAAPERSQSPSKRYSLTQDRRSSSTSSFALAPLEERGRHLRTPSPPQPYGASSTVVVPLAIDRPTESSFLKSRQKEIEMGYSVVTKRQQPPPPLSLPAASRSSPERYGTTTQRGRLQPTHYAQDEPRVSGRDQQYSTFVIARNAGTSEDSAAPRFRTDTYRALKDEYEQQQQQQAQQQAQMARPIGIASPLPNEERRSSATDVVEVPVKNSVAGKDSDLPKYTFGADLQQRRSRFQQFQRSFKKMDDSASDVSVQQSFFVPF
ncbi:uncharacterized protein LOC126575040 [Anopheles aquasalis]|nr:uncharacterized protein LOC126575040 [Anopheles aquasalis]